MVSSWLGGMPVQTCEAEGNWAIWAFAGSAKTSGPVRHMLLRCGAPLLTSRGELQPRAGIWGFEGH